MHIFVFNAFALLPGPLHDEVDCPIGEEDLCARVHQMIDHSNDQSGSFVITRNSTAARLHPDSLFAALQDLDVAMAAEGCALSGEIGGEYRDEWDGFATVDGNPAVLTAGSLQPIDRRARTFPGSVDGFNVLGLEFFGQFSHFKGTGAFIGSVDDGLFNPASFWAGKWVRTSGRKGVFVGALVTCSTGDDPAVVARDWYGSQLDAFAR